MTSKPKVAIVGCGAIGGYVGALMTHAGEDVVLIDIGVAAPANSKLNDVVKRVERGELSPRVANVKDI